MGLRFKRIVAQPSPHISPFSATASQVLPWLRYVSVPGTTAQLWSPQRVKNTPAVVNLTCLATKEIILFLVG
jgi:hypothetical protein